MRFTTFLVSSALAAVAIAQSTTTSANAPESSQQVCLNKCAKGDVNCQAHCVTVPSPNEQNANDTTTCAKGCSQGTGSPEDTKKYGDCIQGCIAKYYYVSTEGTPKATGANNGSGSGSGSGSGADNTATGTGAAATNSGSDSTGSGTQTGTGAAPSKTNAAPGVGVGSSGALVGALAALLVL